MHSDRVEDQAEARLIQLRQQRLRKQSKAEYLDSRKMSSSATGYASDAVKTPVVPIPGMSFMASQAGGNVYATKQMSIGPAGGMSARDQRVISPYALPATATQFQWSPSQPWPGSQANAPAVFSPVLAVESFPDERAEVRQRSAFLAALFSCTYRVWLISATIILTLALFELQSVLDHVHHSTSIWRTIVQWAELSWLAPVPVAIILWLGWFLFAEAVCGNPTPIRVPTLASRKGLLSFGSARPVRLVFRLVTRGDNVEVLRDSVIAIHRAFACYPCATGPYRIEIITECPINLNMGIDPETRIYVVPRGYVTPHHSKFKARALTYLQSQVCPQHEDWFIYLDEESLIDEHMLAGLYHFVQQTLEDEAHTRKKRHPAGVIGQGSILYQGGNWFFRGADALRTADDLGRFRLQYALGVPIFGVHGSYIVIRGIDDMRLSFDVGTANSITEDAAWALRAWSQGYRFAWVEGHLHEQPPQKVKDFVRQRSRWLTGIRIVIRDRETPLRYRLCLGLFTALWQVAFLPFLIATAALIVHASPFFWMRIPADFAWATFFLGYLQGIDVQAKHTHPFLKKKPFEAFWKRILSWPLVLCSIWYALLEAWGVFSSLKPKHEFFVIQKPSLANENKSDPARGRLAEPLSTARGDRML
jgi:egghead protein (zeste-white 4 protein)